MRFIKKYWFSAMIVSMVLIIALIVFAVMLSPKQDVQGRGFVPCTEAMMSNLVACENKISCSISAILNNAVCEIDVIYQGVILWVEKKQAYPWSNYIFEPKLPSSEYIDEQVVEEYLKEYPNVKDDMENLHQRRKDLENENNISEDYQELWSEE